MTFYSCCIHCRHGDDLLPDEHTVPCRVQDCEDGHRVTGDGDDAA